MSKVKFDLEKLKGKMVAVNCVTEEQAQDFVDWVYSLGEDNCTYCSWEKYNDTSCYGLDSDLFWVGVDIKYYKDKGYKVISYEEALLKPTPKEDTVKSASTKDYLENISLEIAEKEKLLNEIKVNKYKKDFIKSFRDSVFEVGGDSDGFDMGITLEDMVNTLAQNGIRFTVDKDFLREMGK